MKVYDLIKLPFGDKECDETVLGTSWLEYKVLHLMEYYKEFDMVHFKGSEPNSYRIAERDSDEKPKLHIGSKSWLKG